MLKVRNLKLYTGKHQKGHAEACKMLSAQATETKCYQGTDHDDKKILIMMQMKLTPHQKGGAEIVYWYIDDRKMIRRGSIFKSNTPKLYQISQ